MVSKGQFLGLEWNRIARLHSQVMKGTSFILLFIYLFVCLFVYKKSTYDIVLMKTYCKLSSIAGHNNRCMTATSRATTFSLYYFNFSCLLFQD